MAFVILSPKILLFSLGYPWVFENTWISKKLQIQCLEKSRNMISWFWKFWLDNGRLFIWSFCHVTVNSCNIVVLSLDCSLEINVYCYFVNLAASILPMYWSVFQKCIVVLERSLKVLNKVLESPWIIKSQKKEYAVNNRRRHRCLAGISPHYCLHAMY